MTNIFTLRNHRYPYSTSLSDESHCSGAASHGPTGLSPGSTLSALSHAECANSYIKTHLEQFDILDAVDCHMVRSSSHRHYWGNALTHL